MRCGLSQPPISSITGSELVTDGDGAAAPQRSAGCGSRPGPPWCPSRRRRRRRRAISVAAAAPMRAFCSRCSRSLRARRRRRARLRARGDRAAVDPAQPPGVLEDHQVAPDRDVGHPEPRPSASATETRLLRRSTSSAICSRRSSAVVSSSTCRGRSPPSSLAHPHREAGDQLALEEQVDDDRRQQRSRATRP